MRTHRLLAAVVAVALWSCATPGTGPKAPEPAAAAIGKETLAQVGKETLAQVEKETLAQVEILRGIKPATDAKSAERYNKQLEDAWKFFIARRKEVSLTLRRQLALELRKTARSDFLLLDLGYFLYKHGEPGDREIAKTALFALDPRDEVVRFNQQELFQFAHEVAGEADERVLPVIEKAFLRDRVTIRMPESGITLDETSVCVFLYGAYGAGAESHLRRLLADAAVRRKVLDILIWVGSPESNPDVRAAMRHADPEVFVRAATFLVAMGGPQGRFLLLNLDPRDLDARNREYYAKIRKLGAGTTFRELRRRFGDGETAAISDEELKRRIAAMNAGYGRDVRVSPAAILDSALPREFLIEQLTRTRAVLLRRTAADVPADVQRTNALLNALRYREK